MIKGVKGRLKEKISIFANVLKWTVLIMMKRLEGRLTEGTVIFISVLKWFVLATVIGAIVGLSTTVFLKILNWSTALASNYSYYFLFLPVALLLSSTIIKYFAPEAEGHGTEKVIEAVHKRSGKIKATVVPVELIATVITLAAGGSVGKEGPCAQIGGGLSSIFADLLRFDDNDRRKLVICGISAGFASVFGTPIAGSIFGVEVLYVGNILYDVLLPSFIAGITSYHISYEFGIRYFYHPIEFVPVFNELFFIKVVFAGIFFGLCSFFMVEVLRFGENVSKKIRIWMPLKGFIGGLVVIILALIFSKQYLGLGLDTIQSCLEGGGIAWYAFILKPIFTTITLSFGGSGGIVTPIFFVGASSGNLFAEVFGLNRATFSAIGLVGLLADAANTPIAASIMALELFGPKIAPYATVACVISFLMTGHRSVYPSQVLAVKKSSSIEVEIGKEMERVEAHFKPREKSLITEGLRIAKKMRDKEKSDGTILLPKNKAQVSRVTRSHEEAKASYDMMSGWYDMLTGLTERKYREAGLQKLGAKEGETILEIGFGTGHCILVLTQSVGAKGRVYGIDISEGMFNRALRRIKEAKLLENVELRRGDASKLPFEANFFDAVFMSFTLELFDTPEIPALLHECQRVLRTGGRICVVALSKKGKSSMIVEIYERFHRKLPKYVDCRPIYARKALEDAGFKIVDVTEMSFLGLLPLEIVVAKKT